MLWPDTTKLFFEESKAAGEHADEILGKYQSKPTKVLALATGALTLFGIEDWS